MTVQPKLRAATAAFVERAPVRWIVLSLVTVAAVWTAALSYREIDRELTAVALMRRRPSRNSPRPFWRESSIA